MRSGITASEYAEAPVDIRIVQDADRLRVYLLGTQVSLNVAAPAFALEINLTEEQLMALAAAPRSNVIDSWERLALPDDVRAETAGITGIQYADALETVASLTIEAAPDALPVAEPLLDRLCALRPADISPALYDALVAVRVADDAGERELLRSELRRALALLDGSEEASRRCPVCEGRRGWQTPSLGFEGCVTCKSTGVVLAAPAPGSEEAPDGA